MKRLLIGLLLAISTIDAYWNADVISEKPKIVFLESFLSDDECGHLIHLASPALKRSTVVSEDGSADGKIDPRRTSQGTFLTRQRNDKIIRSIEGRLSELTQIPRENGEALQILLYEKGAEYVPHYDFFDAALPGQEVHLRRGGQRVATIIMYLNTPQAGGETIFPLAKVSVTPKKGDAVLFYNCLPSGETDQKTLHGGAPVIEGEKWIATKWFRAGRFD